MKFDAEYADLQVPGEYEAEDSSEPLRHYWQIIRKRLWTIILVTCLISGLGVVYAINQNNVYRAAVTIEIRTEAPRVLGGEFEPVIDPAAGARYWSTQEYYETQYRIIRSRTVAELVVEALQLNENLEFLGIDSNGLAEEIQTALESTDPVERLIGMTQIEPIPESQLVEVRVDHTNPELATLLANTIAEVYVERNIQRQLRGTDEAFDWLETERVTSRQRVDENQETLVQFRTDFDLNTTALTDRQQQLNDHLRSVNESLTEVQSEVSALRSELRRIRRARDSELTDAIAIPAVIDNPLIQSLKESREELITERSRLREQVGERNESLRAVNASLTEIDSAISREIEIILDSYDARLAQAQAREDQLLEDRQEIEAEEERLSQVEPVYNQLVRDMELSAEILTMIERRYKETDLYRRQHDVNNIEVLDAAVLPEIPVRPRRNLIVVLAMLLGGALGIGLAFTLELLDNTVRTQEDVERILGLTFLGVVPSIKRSAFNRTAGFTDQSSRDLFIHKHPKSTVAECCRSIRTNLHFMSPDKPIDALLVTSAGPREGKTSTAVNLATVMAQSNQRVLLVDTDMRRPRIHHVFGLENDIGLTNLLLGEVDYSEAVRDTGIPNLGVLACGPIPPNPTELMHTDRFRTVIAELGKRFDRVIFDSPPAIAVADAMILGNYVDGVILVVKTGQTSRDVVRRAKALMEGINAPLLGAVLNDLDLDDRAYRYHYYYSYYYRYGQYYDDQPDKSDKSGKKRKAKEVPASS